MKQVEVYTDGACSGNPGPGGWGAVLRYRFNGKVYEKELSGGDASTTNNRMELTAVIEALSAIKRPVPIILHLDSSYVRNGITGWIHSWKKKGWRTADGKPVKNVELWQKLDELAGRFDIDWRWVKGHAGDLGNERADELANMGAAQFAG